MTQAGMRGAGRSQGWRPRLRQRWWLGALALACHAPVLEAQRPIELAPNAPEDRPRKVDECQWQALLRATAPVVRRARASLGGAIARFQRGLPPGQTFFVTTRLHDAEGHHEQVFVAVDSVSPSRVTGRLWSQLRSVAGYRYRQRLEVARAAVVDWMVARPDGTEEGNVVGKFLDTWDPPAGCGNAAELANTSWS